MCCMPEAHLALRGELFWMKGLTDAKMVLFREEVTSYGLGGVIEGVGEGFGKGCMCGCVCVLGAWQELPVKTATQKRSSFYGKEAVNTELHEVCCDWLRIDHQQTSSAVCLCEWRMAATVDDTAKRWSSVSLHQTRRRRATVAIEAIG